jgi:uncharacterized protein
VLLEYLLYRKTEDRDDNWSFDSYFAQRGYVVARVDIRGTGDSQGRLIPDEYTRSTPISPRSCATARPPSTRPPPARS